MRSKVLKYILLSFLTVITACEVKYPKDIIQPDKMEALLYDYHLVQIMSTDIVGDEYKRKLYAEYVFDKHNVTKEEFDSSMVWYTRNPKHLYEIYASLEEKLTSEIDNGGAVKGDNRAVALSDSLAMEGDIVNLWQGPRLSLLSATPLLNRISFSYKADATYHKGDSIVMQMNVNFISPKNTNVNSKAHAAMVVEYADSTFNSAGRMIEKSGRYSIALPRNYETDISSVRGYVYYSDSDAKEGAKILIDKLEVLRIHPDTENQTE